MAIAIKSLRTDRGPEADAHNAAIFAEEGVKVLIEVTIPAFASRVPETHRLDPQHAGQQAHLAACAEALTWPIPADVLFGEVVTLVIQQRDPDAMSAAAVLKMRLEEVSFTGVAIHPAVQRQIGLVSAYDIWALGSGAWREGRMPQPGDEQIFPEIAALGTLCRDRRVSDEDMLGRMSDWLNGREVTGLEEARQANKAMLARVLSEGNIQVFQTWAHPANNWKFELPEGEAPELFEGLVPLRGPKIALLDVIGGGEMFGACREIGYAVAPILVVRMDGFYRQPLPSSTAKYTLACWGPVTDLRAAYPELTGLEVLAQQGQAAVIAESPWGVGQSVGGSSQKVGTQVPTADVVATIARTIPWDKFAE